MTFSVTYIYPKKYNLQVFLWHFSSHTILEKIASDSLYTSPPHTQFGGWGFSLFPSVQLYVLPIHSTAGGKPKTENEKRKKATVWTGFLCCFLCSFVCSFACDCLTHTRSTRKAQETQRARKHRKGDRYNKRIICYVVEREEEERKERNLIELMQINCLLIYGL